MELFDRERCFFDEEIHPKTKVKFNLNYDGWKNLNTKQKECVMKENYYNKMESYIMDK